MDGMKNLGTRLLLLCGLVAIVFAGLFIAYPIVYQQAAGKAVLDTLSKDDFSPNTFDPNYIEELGAINPNCVPYYENSGSGNDPIDNELSDFVKPYPLSDFLCGNQSDVASTTLSDGKVLYFVDPLVVGFCGSGGCPYFALLEEKKGLVRHVIGFDFYSDAGSTTTISMERDTDGSVFGFLSFPKTGEVDVYWHMSSECGTTNTYTFDKHDNPILISASDSCLPGKGILYPTK